MSREQKAALSAVSQGRKIPEPVDRRSDVYSLGVVLYEALGGPRPKGKRSSPRLSLTDRRQATPFESWTIGLDPAANGNRDASSQTQYQPSSHGTDDDDSNATTKTSESNFPPLHQCNPQVSLELSDLIHKCLASNPAQRYATAGGLAADLRRHIKSEPLREVATRSVQERWQKWRRRKPYVLTLVGMLILLLLAAIAVGLNSWASIRRQIDEVRSALDLGRDQRRTGRNRDAMASFERGLSLAGNAPWSQDLRRQLNEEAALARNDERGQSQLKLIAELHRQVDQIRFEASFNDLSVARMTALKSACQSWWQRRHQILEPGDGISSVSIDAAKTDLIDLAIIGADLVMRSAKGGDDTAARREATAWLDEAESLSTGSSFVGWLRHRITGATPESAPPAVRSAWEFQTVGRALLQDGKTEEAMKAFENAVALHPQGLWPNFYYGLCAYQLGNWEDAIAAFSVCMALAPDSAVCPFNRALAYAALNRNDRAIRDYDTALQRDPNFAAAALNRGILHLKEKRFPAAIADFERAIRDGASPALVHYNLALVYREQGDKARALESVQRALQADAGFADAQALADQLRKH